MIGALATICLILVVVLLSLQVFWAWRFARRYPPRAAVAVRDEDLPRVAVLLCIRGADPSLLGCLRGLANQDYPRYDIHLVIDSPDDPAWAILEDFLNEHPALRIRSRLLERRLPTCSLKLSALVQAIGELDDSYDVVALIDADAVPYPNWLRDLAAPLNDRRVGATTGVRWYTPGDASWGSLVRSLWNAAACTQMYVFHIPWGGSLAFRLDVLRASDLPGRWEHCLAEDTGTHRVLRALGLKLRQVAAVTMVNREAIDLGRCCSFIRRQLLVARLYHELWPAVVTTGLATPLTTALALVLGLTALASGTWMMVAALGVVLTGYVLGMGSALIVADRNISRLAQERGELSYPLAWRALLAAPLTQFVYLLCLVSACFLRKVEWRGITYQLEEGGRVRLLQYRPYQSDERASESTTSLV